METECTKAMLKAAEDAHHLREELATTLATPAEKIIVQVEKEVEQEC
jgi:hypothetical protein